MKKYLKSILIGGASAIALSTGALAAQYNIPSGDLVTALNAYSTQTGVELIVSDDAIKGTRTNGVKGELTAYAALSRILAGTGFTMQRDASGAVGIVRAPAARVQEVTSTRVVAAAATASSAIESVVVTSSKIKGDIQTVPIAITALSQEQLTSRQIAGGPDLVKEVPNLTFSKTNFTGYNIQIRGIGTQAISVTTDPAVAVAFNDTPFIRNHFFEQEFYDVSQVEVLRGPQGTLYGRNATAGVVNVISAKPTDQFEAMASADLGNYHNRRFEGMINVPIVDDRLDIRAAAEWTKRDGYTFDSSLGIPVDGRDLWSGRITLGWKPVEDLQVYAVWEHFQENDDRVRSAKQLCKKDPGPTSVDGLDISALPYPGADYRSDQPASFTQEFVQTWLSQGCRPASLYSAEAYETPNGRVYPFYELGAFINGDLILNPIDPYASQTQSRNLRVIQSLIKPHYSAKNDTLELNADWAVAPSLTLTSQTGYNKDFLYSTEDLNRFDTAPGIFNAGIANVSDLRGADPLEPDGKTYCDPQLGCSQSMVGEDLSQEHAWQFSQELRLASNFSGPLNFSAGANYMHYQTVEDYYVFFNLITAELQEINGQDAGQYTECNSGITPGSYLPPSLISPEPFIIAIFGHPSAWPSPLGCDGVVVDGKLPGTYIDPNPLAQINGQGHNYFRSENPYALNSYAGFGEAYYQVTPDIKLTGGLRWTDDQKTFWNIPSWVFEAGGGYPIESVVHQEWKEWTGRFVANWTPKLDFTDQSLVYASYARGYKGGGANPPGPIADFASAQSSVTHPPTFAPEFINAYELGTKNTLLDGGVTLNGDVFYYDYKGYQISQIVDRTSINLNFDATVKGAELETSWEPMPGLKFNFAGGYEDTSVNKGQSAIDLMDRTAGHSDWMVVRPYVAETSNCILPAAAVKQILLVNDDPSVFATGLTGACDAAYTPGGIAAIFGQNGAQDKAAFAAAGFDPSTAPNNGEGFAKDLGGNKLPNAPKFTTSLSAEYTMPVSEDWAATLHSDFYWQSQSFARIFNDRPYDKIRGYSNVNLALILTSADGWQVMGYLKNVFDTTAITGAFLFSDDTALTTNVFVTDPRLFGVRVTKNL
ncbi:MAG TPA: TonB-dependent receptor [Rhizomicrobium sp.]|nr:TonB-dependent receptor [Rhizomicrobium sp.]